MELEKRVTKDVLTGVLNRAVILERLDKELDRAQRQKVPLGLIFVDLDSLKAINDTYVHSVGDQVLRESAKRMQFAVRFYDIVGRYAGDEFLIIVPGCDEQATHLLAERTCREISIIPYMLSNGKSLIVTVSAGVAVALPEMKIQRESLIDLADQALRDSKKGGKNRVSVAHS